jgi:hypothetical protein
VDRFRGLPGATRRIAGTPRKRSRVFSGRAFTGFALRPLIILLDEDGLRCTLNCALPEDPFEFILNRIGQTFIINVVRTEAPMAW